MQFSSQSSANEPNGPGLDCCDSQTDQRPNACHVQVLLNLRRSSCSFFLSRPLSHTTLHFLSSPPLSLITLSSNNGCYQRNPFKGNCANQSVSLSVTTTRLCLMSDLWYSVEKVDLSASYDKSSKLDLELAAQPLKKQKKNLLGEGFVRKYVGGASLVTPLLLLG